LTFSYLSLKTLYTQKSKKEADIMELLKFFIKDEVPAVGLSKFKDTKDFSAAPPIRLDINRQIFKPNYNNNFFLL
jgi:hypothetical protein